MMYFKSVSGQVFAMDYMPKYMAGLELVHRDVFVAWCHEHGYTPREMGDNQD